jgi:hypothetical protein
MERITKGSSKKRAFRGQWSCDRKHAVKESEEKSQASTPSEPFEKEWVVHYRKRTRGHDPIFACEVVNGISHKQVVREMEHRRYVERVTSVTSNRSAVWYHTRKKIRE